MWAIRSEAIRPNAADTAATASFPRRMQAGGEGGQLIEALGEAEPGRAAT
jgi:hypothetical protein